MYWRMTAMGAPPQLQAKYEGDHIAPPQSLLRMDGYFFSRIIRPETPLRLFTTDETETLGG